MRSSLTPAGFHLLTIPWGSRRDAFRLSAWSRMEKATLMPRLSTLGDGGLLLLEQRVGDEVGHL